MDSKDPREAATSGGLTTATVRGADVGPMVAVNAPFVKDVELLAVLAPDPSCSPVSPRVPGGGGAAG